MMRPPREKSMRKLRMIVLDDDEKILQLFRDYFAGMDYEIITSTKPLVCPIRDVCKDICPEDHTCADVFITDYKMPGLDGIQILREQMRMGCAVDPRNKAVMSGMDDEQLKLEAGELGCALFEKPFMFSDMKAWIDERAREIDLSRPLAILRREERTPAGREPARVARDTNTWLDAFVLNFSTSGLCLEMHSPLEKEGRVHVLRSAATSPRLATVRWARESGNGLFAAGLRYSRQNSHQPAIITP